MNSVTTALTTGLTTVSGDLMDTIAAVLPVALPVLGAILVIGIGIRIFRSFTKGRV